MEPEVAAAIIGTPAVLITAATGWLAGRAQSRGSYHGAVDAVQREAQRQAYADLYRTAVHFAEAHAAVERTRGPGGGVDRDLRDEMRTALGALNHAAEMVYLEGPDKLAELAGSINWIAHALAGRLVVGVRMTWLFVTHAGNG
ncbi:hypothetical protein [Actinacidiphila glaucinigra]|uniref:hypothetical protein n=1 Tax=Actinacidiphila glaucinigra TaxID=235986 RepID=UPI00366E9A81